MRKDVVRRFAAMIGKTKGAAPAGSPATPIEGKQMFQLTKSRHEEQASVAVLGTPRDNEIRKKIRWWIKETPDKTVTMEITPAIASEMLGYNDRNRPVSKKTVERYAADMKAGQWRYTRVPIIFSDQERLIDGQHRLMACVESGVAFAADVAFGAPDDSFYFIDVGRKRGAGDVFAINGVPNHTMAAAATRVLMAYVANKVEGKDAAMYYGAGLDDVYNAYLGFPELQESIKAAGHIFARDRMPHPSTAVAVHYLCAQRSRRLADEYFEKVSSGVGFGSKHDPAYKVREYLTRPETRLSAKDVMAALIQGWNAVRTNKRLGKIDPMKVGRAA